jgi:hypothetical protein
VSEPIKVVSSLPRGDGAIPDLWITVDGHQRPVAGRACRAFFVDGVEVDESTYLAAVATAQLAASNRIEDTLSQLLNPIGKIATCLDWATDHWPGHH